MTGDTSSDETETAATAETDGETENAEDDETLVPCSSCGVDTPLGGETAVIGDAVLCVYCLDAMAATGELQALEAGEDVYL